MTLFNTGHLEKYLQDHLAKHVKYFMNLSDSEDWDEKRLKTYVEQIKIKPINIDGDKIRAGEPQREIYRRNHLGNKVKSREYEMVHYHIPFTGDQVLLELHPSGINKLKPIAEIKNSTITVAIDNDTFFTGNEKLEKEIINIYNGWQDLLFEFLQLINDRVKTYNESLIDFLAPVLEKKKSDTQTKNTTTSNLQGFNKKSLN